MWGWLSRLWGSAPTPADNGKSSGGLHTPAVDCAEADQGRLRPKYLYSADGQPVGIANTTSKYKESRPLRPHLTPFEARVTKMQQEEERLMTASGSIKAATAASADCRSNDATAKKLFASDPAAPEP